ncbi:MAG: transglycosylase domain-containing protein, partial [Myxococcota bacterium]
MYRIVQHSELVVEHQHNTEQFHLPARYVQPPQNQKRQRSLIQNPRKRGWFRKLLQFSLISLLFLGFMGGCSGVLLLATFGTGIPDINDIRNYKMELPSVFFSHDELNVGEVAAKRRKLLPLHKLPRTLIHALVAAEDDRFFQHSGVDPVGILRAMVKNLRHGRIKAGGSTLTQQVAKAFLKENLLLRMKKGLCRHDRQCSWRERCQPKTGSPFGRCVPRSFRSCVKKLRETKGGTINVVYRGYNTLCDPFEICVPKCKTKGAGSGGLCPSWVCMPSAPKPVCQRDATCGFGMRCVEGECRSTFPHQVNDILAKLRSRGAQITRVKAPKSILEQLPGDFPKERSKHVRISVERAGKVKLRSIQSLPGVHSVYRFAKKSIRRKIREAILATRIERTFSKKEIIWLYLNQNDFGH